jgi:hypothetical protein
MGKVQQESPFVTQDHRLEKPVMTHPKKRDHKKADDIGDKVGELLEQGRMSIGDW